MMNLLRRHWPALLLTTIFVLGATSFINIAAEIGHPFGGFFATRNFSTNVWQMDAATPLWWPGFTQAQLRREDVLVKLEGRPYGGEARQIFTGAWQAGRRSVRLTILRAGVELDLEVPIYLFTLGNFLDLRLAGFISGLGFWLIALVVYRARPQVAVNRIFAAAAGLTGMGIWLGIPDLFPESTRLARLLHLTWILLASFTGATIVHLALLFPEPLPRDSLRRLSFLYAFMAGIAGAFALSPLLRWQNRDLPLALALSTLGNNVVNGMFGVGAGIYLARVAYLFWRPASSRRIRREAGWLLFGLAFSLPYVLVLLLRAFAGSTPTFFLNGLDAHYLLLAVPIAFAFVILRYQTSQSTHPLLIVVFILATSAFVASLGTWGLRLLDPPGVNALNWSPFVPLFIITFTASLFWSTQASWQGLLSRLFQWERRSYGAVRQFGQQIVGQTNLAQLPQAIAAALVTHLELERAAVWVWAETEKSFRLAGQAGEWKDSLADKLTPDVALPPHPLRLSTESASLPEWLTPARSLGMLEVVAPLVASGQPVGLLGLGKRWDEEIFDERDLEILDLIAQQAALFLLTASQIEQLRQVPHQVATAQERERFAIAQELHDTVQQFLGRLPFYLQVARDSLHADPAEAEALLQRCITDVESAAQTVRQIRNSLAPLQLERSLTQPLQMLIEHFHSRTGLEIQMTLAPAVDAGLSASARRALYRVVQQALDNVAEHSQAQRVSIALTQGAGRLYFAITDDGIGSTAQQRAQAEAQDSFGLKSMRARITALGGEFAIQSAPNAGTQVSGWLPCKDEG